MTVTARGRESSHEEYLLRKLIVQHGAEVLGQHPWVWEHDRWKELVFAIISRTTSCREADARMLTHQLASLELVEPMFLTHVVAAPINDVERRRILEFFAEAGCSAGESERVVTALGEAARYFVAQHQGKVQRLFRRVGESLVQELKRDIAFSTLAPADVDFVLVYWLQNVLALPLSLKDTHVEQFATDHAISIERLIEAADEMGVNIAYLDDLINFKHRRTAEHSGENHGDA